MSKIGIFNRDEVDFLSSIVADQIPVNSFWKLGIKIVLPPLVDKLDDEFSDKIPEPWQTYAEEMVTLTVDVFKDKVVTDEEIDMVVAKCSDILNKEIDLPILEEEEEAAAFLFLLKFIAATIKGAFRKKKEEVSE